MNFTAYASRTLRQRAKTTIKTSGNSIVKHWPTTIKAFRTKHNLTQRELSLLLPASMRAVQEWEAARRVPPEFIVRALRDLEGEL